MEHKHENLISKSARIKNIDLKETAIYYYDTCMNVLFCFGISLKQPVLNTCRHEGNLTIPEQFYKIIHSIKNRKAVAFLMNSNLQAGSILDYELTVSQLKKTLNLNYFPGANYTRTIEFIDKGS